jgi:hypothetical protein
MKTEWAIYHRRRAKIYADIADYPYRASERDPVRAYRHRPVASTLRSADRGCADFREHPLTKFAEFFF